MQLRLILLFAGLLTLSISDAQTAKKTDEYGSLDNKNAAARLDNYAIGLMMEPGATGYIIIYGGVKEKSAVVKTKMDFTKNYLITSRGIDASRLVLVDGGLKNEPSTELWLVPFGAQPPVAAPTVERKPVKPKKRGR